MSSSRSGSAIIFCIALATIAVMIGYAFLRTATRQTMSGKSEMFIALARDAAESGLAHATAQIITDYNSQNIALADYSGTQTVPNAPTFLDGPFRAPFVSLSNPNKLSYTESSAAYLDDAAEENHLLSSLMSKQDLFYNWWHSYNPGYGFTSGMQIYDARGRYIENGYYNVTRPDPSLADPMPVVPTRFTDLSAAIPEVTDGIFLDQNLQRITTGTIDERRRHARYRIRYAVGVEDLSGHLLANPIGNMNTDWKDPNNDYRNPPPWLDHAVYVYDNMVSTWASSRVTSLRMAHIFRGRGNTNNADRAWDSGSRQGLPAAFPYMFRSVRGNDWYGHFSYNNANPPTPNLGGRLYAWSNASRPAFENITVSPAGGEILTPIGLYPSKPYVYANLGPQYSWNCQIFSLIGASIPGHRYDTDEDGLKGDATWASPRANLVTIPSLFGRRLEDNAGNPADWKWYQGRVNTPWHVNLLTATPQTISEMLLAYIPPYLKTLHYTVDEYYIKIGETAGGADGSDVRDIFSPTIHHTDNNSGKGWDYAIPGLDVLTDQVGSGFSEFPAPSSLHSDGVTVIKPDYYQDPREPRDVDERYPGPLCRGDSTKPNEGYDDLGRDIDVDSAMGQGMNIGWCTHTYNPLLYLGGSDTVRTEDWDTIPPKRFKIIRRLDTSKYTYKHSYFWDMVYAMTTTLAYARATWVQYPNLVFDPRDTSATPGFMPATLRDPLAYDTIEEIDALFLRQMGESFSNPGTPSADFPIIQNRFSKFIRFQVSLVPVSNTINSLVTGDLIKTASAVSSAERGKVMERMLNDFRMSFFGSNPKYNDFRPFDFDGDGKVHCSCYDINASATTDEVTFKTSRWKYSVGNGRGPDLTDFITFDPDLGPSPWFSVTGNFFIGKSHFYRIFTRGEVYDNLLRKPVAQQNLETVLTVDPEAPLFPALGRISSENRILFSQWHYNEATSELPLQMR